MGLIKNLLKKIEKIDFLFPNNFDQLMNDKYYDYDKFEWFLYYVFKLEGAIVNKVGKKGSGDGGADLIITLETESGYHKRIGIQAKYWKNKVGTAPINQLASAKARHSLSDLWIITTSDLTTDAKEIAESLNIKILRGEDVRQFIETVKQHYKKDIDDNGESSITFLPIKEVKKVVKTEPINKDNNLKDDQAEALRKLRISLSEKHKLTPVYIVFNNKTLDDLIEKQPKSKTELEKITGLGLKKIDMFGDDLINFFADNNKNDKDVKTNDVDSLLYEFLLEERIKISKFNKISIEDIYSDQVALNLVKMKPKNKKILSKVYGFKKENIEIFGDYLVRVIAKFLEE
ncbi:MAG TPA: hypothetical protein GX742_00880 [Acholeplasmataceae bacterium]|nr:hypothetical protein [Acholeplasmataceae bacterium]